MAFKRIISVMLILVLLASLLTFSGLSAAAEEYVDSYGQTYGYVTYEDQGKTKVAIGAWRYDNIKSIVIPSHINGYPVTMIIDEAFKERAFTKVTLPDTIEYIGAKAFWSCPLTEVNIPENVQYIAGDAFGSVRGCLTKFTVDKDNKNFKSSDGVIYTKDGRVLVKYPDGKKDNTFNIPEGVEGIYDGAFRYAESLKKVVFPQSLVAINKEAFFHCGLESVCFAENVQYVGEKAFSFCNNLKKVGADKNAYPYFELYVFSNTPWENEGGEYIDHLLYRVGGSAKSGIREGTTAICHNAIEGYLGDVTLKIPASMEIIPVEPFMEISDLEGFEVHEDNLYFASIDGMLYTKDKKMLIIVPTYRGTTMELPESTEEIFTNAFGRRCSNLQNLIVPENVNVIYDEAFANLEIRKITFLGNAHYCGENIFGENESLVTIDLPEGATMLGVEDVKNTRWYANRKAGFVREGSVLLGYKSQLVSANLEIPDDVTSIGRKAFMGKSVIEEVKLPEGLVGIGSYAFANCPNLKEVEVPASVDEMGMACLGFNVTFDEETGMVTSFEQVEGFVIKGYTNSFADSYADANGFEFVSVGYLEPESTLLGDLDCDGRLTVKDATAVQKYVAGMTGINTQDKINADFNCDGKINIRDATAIQKKLAHLI